MVLQVLSQKMSIFIQNYKDILAFGLGFTNCSRVLPPSRVVYYAGKPIEKYVLLFNYDTKADEIYKTLGKRVAETEIFSLVSKVRIDS